MQSLPTLISATLSESSLAKTLFSLAFFVSVLCAPVVGSSQEDKEDDESKKIAVLIVDGQNNHAAWPKTTVMMKSFLEESGRFDVDVYRSKFTWKGDKLLKEFPLEDGKDYESLEKAKSDPDFKPDFAKYDVVVSNFGYGAAPWPEETKTAFVEFMKNGGGLVSIHAADNSFPLWPEYNQMIGLGGWGGRNETSGPYIYIDENGKVVRDESKGGGGGHGPQHEFSLVVRDSKHPITEGLPSEFMHAKDELYERLRGPGENMKILATAFASPKYKGSGRHEPTIMALDFGKGRIFHSTLGHADYSCESVAFITLFLRGTEWAGTGAVTIPIPEDFPTADKSSSRKFAPAASVK